MQCIMGIGRGAIQNATGGKGSKGSGGWGDDPKESNMCVLRVFLGEDG